MIMMISWVWIAEHYHWNDYEYEEKQRNIVWTVNFNQKAKREERTQIKW